MPANTCPAHGEGADSPPAGGAGRADCAPAPAPFAAAAALHVAVVAMLTILSRLPSCSSDLAGFVALALPLPAGPLYPLPALRH